MSTSRLLSRAADDESGSRGAASTVVVLLHAGLIVALLQVGEVRRTLADAAPVFVSFVTDEPPRAEAPPPPPVSPRREPPPIVVSTRAATPSTEFVAPPPPPDLVIDPTPVEPAPAPAAPAVGAPSAPKLVTQVEYVRRPAPEYPALSRRLGEQGRVVVRVLINRSGHAERVELHEASPYRRLNEAALAAAHEAIYRPYAENGQTQTVWALVPLSFELNR